MTLAFRPDEANARVSVLLADLGLAPDAVDLGVDDRDEMLTFLLKSYRGDRDSALFQYFQSGESIANSLLQVLRWRFGDDGDFARIHSLLDFASGYGRVTRFLVREVPAARVRVADVYADGVRFQAERLGVQAIVSAIRPEDFACAERFDAILVTSLFTHLPEERFVDWLRVLLGLLNPGGLLVFSSHSPEVLPAGVEMPASGIVFAPISESGSLDTSDYGSTWVTRDFVRSSLERALGPGAPAASLHTIERALCNFQDLHLVVPEADVDFSSLAFQGEPQLFVERAELDAEGCLKLEGWAAVRNGSVREVEVWLNEERLGSTPVAAERGDVAGFFGGPRHAGLGWACCCRLPAAVARSAAVLRLRVVDGGGRSHVLWAGSVADLLLASLRLESEQLRGWLRHSEAVLAAERARTAVETRALADRIAAMRASRFWKLRNVWFRFKALVGLAAASEVTE
ncbi:MAG TPA: class I SAM-dependent methyltransferase [Thermoanaerobaculia bacterium]|jgi:SAM-dependent methyltransferase|nr:class I SAM-dependent methyltransferase [Thermoanaerobaculia bacterium]